MHRLAVTTLALMIAACTSTLGTSFPGERVDEIRIGETRSEQIREMFGPPWQVGLEDGQVTWTYTSYRRPFASDWEGRDLVVLFDDTGRVTSYRFHTTMGGEHER